MGKYKETIGGIRPDEIGRPTGAYRVELFDDRGKLKERVDSKNYITPVHEQFIRWWQGQSFHYAIPTVDNSAKYQYFPPNKGDGTWEHMLANPAPLPTEVIIGLDSAEAENTSSAWATGQVQGFGYRYKTTVASAGRQGEINESQCLSSRSSVRLVWDFNEDQGNGTYNSFVMGRMCHTREALHCSPGLPIRTLPNPGPQNRGSYVSRGPCAADATYWYGVWAQQSNAGFRFHRWAKSGEPAAHPTRIAYPDDGSADLDIYPIGGTLTWSTGADQINVNTDVSPSICPIPGSTDLLFAYASGTGDLRMIRMTIAGAIVWGPILVADSGTTLELNEGHAGVCINSAGTKAYASIRGNPTYGDLGDSFYRVDMATQTADAVFPLDYGRVDAGGIQYWNGVLYVSTDKGIQAYDESTGNYIESYGTIEIEADPWFTGLTPWSTVVGYGALDIAHLRNGHIRSTYGAGGDQMGYGRASQVTNTIGYTLNTASFIIDQSDGKWYTGNLTKGSSDWMVTPLLGRNCFSRTVLGGPVTKTTSGTMKWTYELTFPEESWAEITHGLPPGVT